MKMATHINLKNTFINQNSVLGKARPVATLVVRGFCINKTSVMAKSTHLPALCLTCGVRDDHTHPAGYCQNNHDNWMDIHDFESRNEYFKQAVNQSGLTEQEFIEQFENLSNKLIPQIVAK